MQQLKKSYIGVTGFTHNIQVSAVLETWPENGTHDLMVGVLLSEKTMRGGENGRPQRYPKSELIQEIFPWHLNALNLVHYNTKNQQTLFEQMERVTALAGPNFHGFQLNLPWPAPQVLEQYRRKYSEKKLVLQIGKKALREANNSPEGLLQKLEAYSGLIDYILIDASGGEGEILDIQKLYEYLIRLKGRDFPFNLGVAGGLSRNTLHLTC